MVWVRARVPLLMLRARLAVSSFATRTPSLASIQVRACSLNTVSALPFKTLPLGILPSSSQLLSK